MVEYYETLRSLWVVWLFGLFLAIAVWAYWPSNKRRLEAQAQIPFNDEQRPTAAKSKAEG